MSLSQRLQRLIPIPLVLLLTTGLALTAQSQSSPSNKPQSASKPTATTKTSISVQDALNRPFDFPFAKPTPLEVVAAALSKALQAPVVLDRAALNRLEMKPEDSVQLQLEGVRLKTGLKLLLDQVGLTFQVVAEDNLLIFTDIKGSRDPIDEVLVEIKALHREMHDVQDAVDDLRATLGIDDDEGAQMRKPTIIEELPGEGAPKPKIQGEPMTPLPRTRPGV